VLQCATDENQGWAGDAFGGICGVFGRRIGRGGLAEGVRTVSVRLVLRTLARIGVISPDFARA
jgi:hypothetical protein